MKKTVLFLVMFCLSSLALAVTPYDNSETCLIYFGTIPLANDTVWYPGLGTNNSYPDAWGISLDGYKYLGYEVDWLSTDTTHPDMICTLYVDLYTGYMGGSKDSISIVIPADSVVGAHIGNTSGGVSAKKWACVIDTAYTPAPYWFQRYAWWAVRSRTTQSADTTFTGAPDGDLWAADGDSLIDWQTQNADGIWYAQFNEASWDSFVYVTGEDSLLAVAMDEMTAGTDPGVIDSLKFFIAFWDSAITIAADTLRVGIVFGDSTQHHYDSLDIGVGGSGVLWSANLSCDSSISSVVTPRPRDTVSVAFPTDPHGNAWTRTSLDSCIVILDPVHIDTTSAGAAGTFCVYRLWTVTYHSRDELEPDVDFRLTIWRKQ